MDAWMDGLQEMLDRGDVKPLPTTVFGAAEVLDALRCVLVPLQAEDGSQGWRLIDRLMDRIDRRFD